MARTNFSIWSCQLHIIGLRFSNHFVHWTYILASKLYPDFRKYICLMMNLTRNQAYLGYTLVWLSYCILHLFRLIFRRLDLVRPYFPPFSNEYMYPMQANALCSYPTIHQIGYNTLEMILTHIIYL